MLFEEATFNLYFVLFCGSTIKKCSGGLETPLLPEKMNHRFHARARRSNYALAYRQLQGYTITHSARDLQGHSLWFSGASESCLVIWK